MAMIAIPVSMDVPLRTDETGTIRVGKSRVLLDLVIYAFQQGETAESIIESYPSLKLADVYAVIAYYLTHRGEVDAYIAERDAEGERIQKEVEANYTPEHLALRERLRAFRDKNERAHP
jgi:uncharacterized protein (DUF433 family)